MVPKVRQYDSRESVTALGHQLRMGAANLLHFEEGTIFAGVIWQSPSEDFLGIPQGVAIWSLDHGRTGGLLTHRP